MKPESPPPRAHATAEERRPEALSNDQGSILLRLARNAIADRLGAPEGAVRHTEKTGPDAWLEEPRATFVSLHIERELRGCIGTVEAVRALRDDVRANARAAAFEDPRFPALTLPELGVVDIEVSLLSPATLLEARDEAHAAAQLMPGTHGLVLRHAGRRATFLPQVWEAVPEPATFLEALKQKCGLARTFWSDKIELSTYTVDSWSESREP